MNNNQQSDIYISVANLKNWKLALMHRLFAIRHHRITSGSAFDDDWIFAIDIMR